MRLRVVKSSDGFTYIAALVMVVIMGIMASQVAVVWRTAMQREREVELLYRGSQIRDAMQRYYYGKVLTKAPTQLPPARPNLKELKDLLQDPSSTEKKRYLRPSNLIEPITGKEWALVKDASQKIIGVASPSEAEPVKKGNFPDEFIDFEGKKKYSEWQFIYTRFPVAGAKAGTVSITGGTSTPSGSGTVTGGSPAPAGAGAPKGPGTP